MSGPRFHQRVPLLQLPSQEFGPQPHQLVGRSMEDMDSAAAAAAKP